MTRADFWRSPLDPERVMQVDVTRWQDTFAEERIEHVTIEEPLEIHLAQQSLAMIMRTPGHDHELALGFLLSEGIIGDVHDVVSIQNAVDEDGLPLENVVDIVLNQEHKFSTESVKPLFERHFVVSASCGVCGKNSIADLLHSIPPLKQDALRIEAKTIYALSEHLRTQQAVFKHTGGLHAAGLFSPQGELLMLREDVGRHNAVDKIIGNGFLTRTFPFREHILLVSGRTSYEIIQKALLARIPCVAAISAPSSLAVELAAKSGITLIGFLRDHTMNVYTHPHRVVMSS